MVRVYFETDGYSELVAKFDSEDTFFACVEALEDNARKHNFDVVTESIDEEIDLATEVEDALVEYDQYLSSTDGVTEEESRETIERYLKNK